MEMNDEWRQGRQTDVGKMATTVILDSRKSLLITFLSILSLCNFYFAKLFFMKWPLPAIMDARRITISCIPRHFGSICNFQQKNSNSQNRYWRGFSQNSCWRIFGWTEITFDLIVRHFRSGFFLIRINSISHFYIQNDRSAIFLMKWLSTPISNARKSNFSPSQIIKQLFSFSKWLLVVILDVGNLPKLQFFLLWWPMTV